MIFQSPSSTKEAPLSHQETEARKHKTRKATGERVYGVQRDDQDIAVKTADDLFSISWSICNTFAHLGSVVVEYDGIQVSTVVMLDEIFSGIRGLQTTCSEAFMLEQSLI